MEWSGEGVTIDLAKKVQSQVHEQAGTTDMGIMLIVARGRTI